MADRVNTPLRVALVVLVVCGVAAILGLLVLSGGADIFKNALDPGGAGRLNTFVTTINDDVKGPVNLAMATIVPIGLAAGGGMMALGQSRGMGIIGASAGAGALVLLGNGLVA